MTERSLAADTDRPPVPSGDAAVRRVHHLKSWPTLFEAIVRGDKRHELRRAYDRDFRKGDRLRLREFDPDLQRYTGREQIVEVTFITSAEEPCALSDQALHPDYCILSIAPVLQG